MRFILFSFVLACCVSLLPGAGIAQRLVLKRTDFIGGTNRGVDFFQSHSIQAKDKGIIICGTTRDTGSGDIPHQPHPINDSGDVILVKLDSLGNKQWVKTYGKVGPEGANGLCQTVDGGYGVLTGSSNRLGDICFDRVDPKGNYLWSSRDFGSSGQEGIAEIISTTDHGFLIAGNSMGADGDIPYNFSMPLRAFQPADWVLLKTDSLGKKQWLQVLGSSGDESFGNFSVTTDGSNYYTLGAAPTKDHDCADPTRLAAGYGGYSPYIIKLDGTGKRIWSKAFGGGYTMRMVFDPRDSTIVGMGEGAPAFEFNGGHGSRSTRT